LSLAKGGWCQDEISEPVFSYFLVVEFASDPKLNLACTGIQSDFTKRVQLDWRETVVGYVQRMKQNARRRHEDPIAVKSLQQGPYDRLAHGNVGDQGTGVLEGVDKTRVQCHREWSRGISDGEDIVSIPSVHGGDGFFRKASSRCNVFDDKLIRM
jgi:hypothetical protein